MNLNKFFYLITGLLFLLAAFIFACPFFITPELICPVRVDSLYVKYESEKNAISNPQDVVVKINPPLYNPGSLGMAYQNFNIKTADSLTLRGWYVSTGEEESNTLLIIHDLSQSKISYLNMMKQMYDRGLNICAVDMRAHGNSDGDEFSPGMVTVADFKIVLDSLQKKKETNHVAVFGAGLGAAVAIQLASVDERCEALIVQSPFVNFYDYVNNYVKRKWKIMGFVLHVVLERKLEKQLQYELKDLDLPEIVRYIKTPSLFICGGNDEIIAPVETYATYDSSGAKEKNLILVKKAEHDNIEQIGGEEYYNSIAQFIANVIPKKVKDTRFKKLALQ